MSEQPSIHYQIDCLREEVTLNSDNGAKAAKMADEIAERLKRGLTGPDSSNGKGFKWVVEFEVHECWVEDGFNLTDERALDMLSNDLQFANIGTELRAKVLLAPDRARIMRVQGYSEAEIEAKK